MMTWLAPVGMQRGLYENHFEAALKALLLPDEPRVWAQGWFTLLLRPVGLHVLLAQFSQLRGGRDALI